MNKGFGRSRCLLLPVNMFIKHVINMYVINMLLTGESGEQHVGEGNSGILSNNFEIKC